MSGGFFRGTSTDQDTRFSNKKAKLLKSQKFAAELETLVDMTKVKLDVMRPWIAKRVTELIGFEDEVLINFIYGLLEGKEVNGKEVQISLTGFMERNTGKFMKELWLLLLSAQKNMSGIPQQFLDAKEEETKKKKAETDRIAHEILRKKEREKQELERKTTKMDGDNDALREKPAGLELNPKPDSVVSGFQPADESKQSERKSMRGRSRDSKSSDLAYRSSSPRQRNSTPPRKTFSNSRSHSEWSSRSASRSPLQRRRSISSERRYPTSPRQSPTPRKRHVVQPSPSPPRRRSSYYFKRRSISPSRRRSPSPSRYRARSPRRYRSRSPLIHRSRSPFHRRSRSPSRRSRTPIRTSTAHHRSPSPLRHRSPSPVPRKSPSPARRRSPFRLQRRTSSPLSDKSQSRGQHRSPSPLHRRPRSPFHRRPPYVHQESRSPVRRQYQQSLSTSRQQSISPVQRMPSMISRKRSSSPAPRRSRESSSPSSIRRSSISPVRRESSKGLRSPQQSHGERVRSLKKNSPAHYPSPSERAELPAKILRGSKPVHLRPIISLRSPQRDMLDQNDLHGNEPALSFSKKTPPVSDASRERAHSEEQRLSSPRDSLHQRRERVVRPLSPSHMVKDTGPKPHRDRPGASVEDKNNFSAREQKYGARGTSSLTSDQPKDLTVSTKTDVLDDVSKSTKSQLTSSEIIPDRMNRREPYEKPESSDIRKTTTMREKKGESYVDEGDRDGDVNSGPLGDSKRGYRLQEPEVFPKLSRKSELNDLNGSIDSPSKESDEQKTEVKGKKKRKKPDRHDVESDDSVSDHSYEERKEVRRRRKEEKRLKRDERRRRRDERHRRKEERRAEKWKLKSADIANPLSDLERDYSEDDNDRRWISQGRGNKDSKSEQKNLEIELREKALESLRAKKKIGNSRD